MLKINEKYFQSLLKMPTVKLIHKLLEDSEIWLYDECVEIRVFGHYVITLYFTIDDVALILKNKGIANLIREDFINNESFKRYIEEQYRLYNDIVTFYIACSKVDSVREQIIEFLK